MPAKKTKKPAKKATKTKSRCAVALGRKGGKASAASRAKKKTSRRRTSKKRPASGLQGLFGF